MNEVAKGQEKEEFGLKDDWESVERALKEIIPVYDRVNRYISLGSDLRIRRKGVSLLKRETLQMKESFPILDLGCGPGKMTQILLDSYGADDDEEKRMKDSVLLLDALVPMLRVARERILCSQGVISVYENLPLRNESFGAAMAGFAIRDARNLSQALMEVWRVLSSEGLFLIVDLCKPDSKFKRGMNTIYWRVLSPFIAFLVSGSKGTKFGALFTTFERLPKNSQYAKLAESAGFDFIIRDYSMLGGACVLLLRKMPRPLQNETSSF